MLELTGKLPRAKSPLEVLKDKRANGECAPRTGGSVRRVCDALLSFRSVFHAFSSVRSGRTFQVGAAPVSFAPADHVTGPSRGEMSRQAYPKNSNDELVCF